MKAVNAQTQFLLEKLRTKQREAAEAGDPLPSPFTALDKGRKALGREWDESTKRLAIEALAMWIVSLVAGMLTSTMNEIAEVGRFAANSDDEGAKKAAYELAGSMGFVETVMTLFAEALDFEYIAEQFFEDGRKAAEAAAAEEKAEVSAFERKCKPSAN